MKKLILSMALLAVSTSILAQPRYNKANMMVEKLDRGVVAIRQDAQNVMVSWRTLESDKKGQAFDVYRNGKKLNTAPLTAGGTFFADKNPLAGDATYEVRGGGINGKFTLKGNTPSGYLPIKINKPADGVAPDGRGYTYSANDASVGDVDGDGQYEIILKWDPSNAHDNAHAGFTGNTYFDCYRINGEHLWRIDLGRNIRSGAHYIPFIVFDLDGDGRAEMMVKTADGTVDGQGNVIGDKNADWRSGAKEAMNGEKSDGSLIGRIMAGPEFITVFNGLTGKAMDTQKYNPDRGAEGIWGDNRGNRSERYLAGVGYFDGKRPSAFFCRGYYTRTVIAAWNWDGKKLSQPWTFDSMEEKWKSWGGQGFHNLRVADVDADGKDEIVYGSMVLDHDGTGLYNTRMGHGDAMHLTAFDPSTDKLQVWTCHENRRDGSVLRDAATGEKIFQITSNQDVGRAMAADIDPTNPGVEMWSSDSKGIRTIKGDVLTDKARVSVNFAVWWDGDLLRELLDNNRITKYNWNTQSVDQVLTFEGSRFNNGSKSNPCLSGDIIGDWREEVLVRAEDNSELRLYSTTIPTDYRINCLMQDVPYRLSVAAENVAYNQPPQAGFYLGPDKKDYLK